MWREQTQLCIAPRGRWWWDPHRPFTEQMFLQSPTNKNKPTISLPSRRMGWPQREAEPLAGGGNSLTLGKRGLSFYLAEATAGEQWVIRASEQRRLWVTPVVLCRAGQAKRRDWLPSELIWQLGRGGQGWRWVWGEGVHEGAGRASPHGWERERERSKHRNRELATLKLFSLFSLSGTESVFLHSSAFKTKLLHCWFLLLTAKVAGKWLNGRWSVRSQAERSPVVHGMAQASFHIPCRVQRLRY